MPRKNTGPKSELPGLEEPRPQRNATLERLADDWLDAADKLATAKETHDEAKESLASQMRSSNTLVYRYDGHLIQLTPGKDKITVKDVANANPE